MLPLGSLDDESEGEVKVIILKPVSKQSLLKLGPVMFAFIIRILTKKVTGLSQINVSKKYYLITKCL